MGSRLAASCRHAERRLWLPEGRSGDTGARAQAEGLEPVDDLVDAVAEVEIVVSVCPPSAAEAVADQVASAGFDGIYVDANAIAPTTTRRIGRRFTRFVDGGIIGPPPTRSGSTRLYLSGDRRLAEDVAALWAGSELDVRVIDGDVGSASALKMSYAAWTKGSAALLATVVAGAEAMDVGADLAREWKLSQPGLDERVTRMAEGVGPKAWRFAGEMREIASTFSAAGLPNGFWTAAAEAYDRLAPLRDVDRPDVDILVDLLRSEPT